MAHRKFLGKVNGRTNAAAGCAVERFCEHQNPPYLACMWCPSQAYLAKSQPKLDITLYICTAGHRSYIEAEDTSFDYGYNYEKEEHEIRNRHR